MRVDLNSAVAQARSANELPPVGSLVCDKYRVDGLLGSGGMGIILAATHVALERPVAIKILPEKASREESHLARFRREARALASIRSEHVVHVLDYGTLPNGAPFIVLERLEGTVLSEILEARGQLPIEEAVGYILQAAEGIAEAHRLGIVHRDLKPANMFVVVDNGRHVLKVFDFGASKLTEDSALQAGDAAVTRENSLIGSPRYMAPEQLRSVLQVDTRADVYALGMTLHEMLAGEPMFDGRSLEDILAKVLWEKPRSLATYRSDIPVELDAVVLRCLEKGKRERFQSVEELVAGLDKFATGRYSRSVMRMKAKAMLTPPQPIPVPAIVKASVAATTLATTASGVLPAMVCEPAPETQTMPPTAEPSPPERSDDAPHRAFAPRTFALFAAAACVLGVCGAMALRAGYAGPGASARPSEPPEEPIVAERRVEHLPSVVRLQGAPAPPAVPSLVPAPSAPRPSPRSATSGVRKGPRPSPSNGWQRPFSEFGGRK